MNPFSCHKAWSGAVHPGVVRTTTTKPAGLNIGDMRMRDLMMANVG